MLDRADAVVALTVQDAGIGVTEQEVEQNFTRFIRGEAALRRDILGAGLGRNYLSPIVEAHGRRVDLGRQPQRRTALRIRLSVPGTSSFRPELDRRP